MKGKGFSWSKGDEGFDLKTNQKGSFVSYTNLMKTNPQISKIMNT